VGGGYGLQTGLFGLHGLESVWKRFTKCGFWGEKGGKIGLHGLERFAAPPSRRRYGGQAASPVAPLMDVSKRRQNRLTPRIAA
jgi:hypothetical protein